VPGPQPRLRRELPRGTRRSAASRSRISSTPRSRAANATKSAAVAGCKNDFPEGPDRDACITDALVVAFQCRDQGAEDAKPRFEACRAGFKACAEACPAS
jgi:hypothetical protein